MAKAKKKSGKGKKKTTKSAKTQKAKLSVNPKTDATGISDGTMKDAFRQAFLRREI